MDNISALLKKAINRNILVFDADAKREELTIRLLALMKTVAFRNNLGQVKKFLIPSSVKSINFNNLGEILEGATIELIEDPTPELKILGGTIESKDSFIVLALCEQGPLVGSY